MSASIPSAAWTRPLDQDYEAPGKPAGFNFVTILELMPAIMRMRALENRLRASGRRPVQEVFDQVNPGATGGVPLGGLGGGTIMRGWRGDFNRWQMEAGIYEWNDVAANAFSVYIRRGNSPRGKALVLRQGQPRDGSLAGWGWGLRGGKSHYHALHPRAWTVYEEPDPKLRLTCRQISPLIPGDYEASATPAALFVWTLENTGDTAVEIGIMFSWQNGWGRPNDKAGGHHNHLIDSDDLTGVALHHRYRQGLPLKEGQKLDDQDFTEDPLTFAIAAAKAPGLHLSYRTRWATNGSGMDLWSDFSADGHLENVIDEHPAPEGRSIGAAICATVTLSPGETREIPFALAWDMPIARFGEGRGWYRRYTRRYGRAGEAAPGIAADALRDYPQWERQIEAWQARILDDAELPGWFKAGLLNEAYFLADGGTVWLDAPIEPLPEDAGPVAALISEDEMGLFGYLESHEYRFYNTYDVHFYASFALAALWPKLERNIQRQFARALPVEDPEIRRFLYNNKAAPRKVAGAIPHDIGGPTEDPFVRANAYSFQETSHWKDLNTKFVLQAYRSYIATGDRDFLAECWPAMQQALDYLQQFDQDDDGLIENEGYPDQTYDTWKADGPSAYTGGLWLAALQAAAATARLLGDESKAADYEAALIRGQASYEDLLWNGDYYDYDASRQHWHDSIMADQLAGHWYARASGLPGIVPAEHAQQALKQVFEFNVMQYEEGLMGAVNGMRPDGRVDTTTMQSREVWTGTSYALAAAMLQEGLREEAFKVAEGVVTSTHDDLGYGFMTPEAWDLRREHRALGYMRPLAIWAIYWAWERKQ